MLGSGECRTNLPTLMGEIDDATGSPGKKSLRIHVDGNKPIIYRGPMNPNNKEEIRAITAANIGWIPLAAAEHYVFSCYLKADKPNTTVRLLVVQPSPNEITSPLASKSATVGTDWQRVSLPVQTKGATFAWVAAGLDMSKAKTDSGTLWLSALQFEHGENPTEYAPRARVESFINSSMPGNIFTDPAAGMNLRIAASNRGDAAVTVKGTLSITDFWDREVMGQDVQLAVAAQAQAAFPLDGVLKGRKGFFRVSWKPENEPQLPAQTMRCAVIDEYQNSDSPFGMNFAYPWPVLKQLAKKGGLTWMRDSAAVVGDHRARAWQV